ncbi:MAG: aminopeptidase P family protein [Marinilabiliaceae bacterium]|nr:aminopeptidase P family protein [Marinilabiliaceae bacterium]
MEIHHKIFSVRDIMASEGLEAYIVSSNDQHLSEYVAAHWKFREYLSGFTGSVGTLVILDDEVGLWTDSRYFLQAEKELDDSIFTLFKMGEPDVPSIEDWIVLKLEPGSKVGLDGRTFSIDEIRKFNSKFKKQDIRLETKHFFMDEIWTTKPIMPEKDIFDYPIEFAGLSRTEKMEIIRDKMHHQGITHYIIGALDEIAWVLNMRGSDVPYNPVFHSFLIIGLDGVNLFIDPHKITSTTSKKLTKDDIKVSLYEDFYKHLSELSPYDNCVYIDPTRINAAVLSSLPNNMPRSEGMSFITSLKAIKNNTEIKGIENAMIKDGIAMVEFLYWLENTLKTSNTTELEVAQKLKYFRSKQPGFQSESFNTIAAYNANGAVVHYNVNEESNTIITPNGLLLIDSGGQYMEGTTDITRTIALGDIPQKAFIDYTMVLKGHIALDSISFPKGTRGVHIDSMARQHLWKHGLNYGHGTGHGVGCFLNVHEGPQSIRPVDNGIPIEVGMITSNEPGLYRTNEYGIRIENINICEKHIETIFGEFFRFRTLTICPIDLTPVKTELLNQEEIDWINNYHSNVYSKLAPSLNDEHKKWLKEKTKPIK